MDKVKENSKKEKKLEEYDYQELDTLKWKIKEMPDFVISNDKQNSWFNKISKLQEKILDEYEKHSNGSRYDKVKKYLEYTYDRFGHTLEGNYVKYGYADRRPFGCSIDEFYLDNRYNIECLWIKIQRLAPMTKEQLELLVVKDIDKYI